jgi:hypothetical protein
MQIVNFPTSSPFLFWTVAIVWSAFQAYAGFQYGLYIYDSAHKDDSHKPRVRLVAYGLHHGAFYCLCSLSGFAAWCLAHWVSERIGNWSEVAGGTGAILVALAVFSILGISGALPRILYLGNRPV